MKKAIELEAFGNLSLIESEEYVHQMKKLISDTLHDFFNENILDNQVK